MFTYTVVGIRSAVYKGRSYTAPFLADGVAPQAVLNAFAPKVEDMPSSSLKHSVSSSKPFKVKD